MRVHIGGDHAAYELQRALVTHLQEAGHEVIDHGPLDYDAQDDYPVYVLRAAVAVAEDIGSRGIVLGGSGNGELITAPSASVYRRHGRAVRAPATGSAASSASSGSSAGML